jgi:nitroreductase
MQAVMRTASLDAPIAGPAEAGTAGEWASALIQARCTVLPRRLAAPGPDPSQLELILGAAAAAPDHGELVPWRFVLIPESARAALGAVFEQSLLERDPAATAQQCGQAREKAFRAPVLLLAIARLGGGNEAILAAERLVSAGCAVQNMLLMATALGFGSALTSGKALQSAGLRRLFSLQPQEQPLCFLSLGTALSRRPRRARPALAQYGSELELPA